MDMMTAIGEIQALHPHRPGRRAESEDVYYARYAGSDAGLAVAFAALSVIFGRLVAAITAAFHVPATAAGARR